MMVAHTHTHTTMVRFPDRHKPTHTIHRAQMENLPTLMITTMLLLLLMTMMVMRETAQRDDTYFEEKTNVGR